jgi:hypothetical protein
VTGVQTCALPILNNENRKTRKKYLGISNNTMLVINDCSHYYLQMILKILRKLSAKLDHLVWYLEMRRRNNRNK